MTAFLIFPYWSVSNETETHLLYPFFYLTRIDSSEVQVFIPWALAGGMAALAAIIAIVEIFRYSNRVQQIKMGFLNSMIMASVIAITLWLSSKGQKEFLPEGLGQYMLPGFFLPALAMVFNVVANRFIRRDENLVRSVDRLR